MAYDKAHNVSVVHKPLLSGTLMGLLFGLVSYAHKGI